MEQWYELAAEDAVPVGGMLACAPGGRPLVLCRTAEGWFAVDDLCSHAEARLSEGRLRGCRLTCPLHGAAFDLHSGQPLGPPAVKPVGTHPVRLRNGRVEVALRG